MTNKKEIKKYCPGIDCLTCDEAEPCIYRIANELQEKLQAKEQECEELKRVKDDFFKHAEISHEAVLNKNKIIDEQEKQLNQLKVENEELKTKIKYMEEYIKTVENSRNEFEKENKFLKEGNKRLARVTQHKEEELQAQRNFTAQEQHKIYCVAYDKTCETGNECKQKKCVFKDRLKYKQALDEIEEYLDAQQKYFDGEDYHNLLDTINKAKEQ